MARITDIADAVVAAMNGHTFSHAFTAARAYRPVFELQDMKDLLDSCKRLRADIARAVRYGRTSDSYLASAAADPYRRYGNLDSYAAKLFAALPD